MTPLQRVFDRSSWRCDGRLGRVFVVLLGLVSLALVVCLSARVHPLLETVTNVRAQLIPVALIPAIGFVALRHWRLAAVASLVLVAIALPMWPYWTADADVVPADAETIRVMQYNIFFGNEDYDAIVAHITEADADVVALHELLPTQWHELESRLDGYPYRIAAPLAHVEGQPGGGMALISRYPLTEVEVDKAFNPPERVTLVAETELGRAPVTIVGLHPHASRTNPNKVALREAQLAGVVDLAAQRPGPMVILADLNAAPTSPVYQGFVDDLGWRDPHGVVGWHSTWPTWGGPFGMAIDHVFVSNEFALHGYELGGGGGSDHKSVTADLSLRVDD